MMTRLSEPSSREGHRQPIPERASGTKILKPNTKAILEASNVLFENYSGEGEKIVRVNIEDQFFALSYKVIALPNGNLKAKVSLKSSLPEKPFQHATIQAALDEYEMAAVEVEFKVKKFKKEVDVTTKYVCKPQHEGKGYTTGLALLTDDVIENVREQNKDLFNGYAITDYIDDVAKGQTIDTLRDGWSSMIARTLGYNSLGSGQLWGKKYQ